MTKNANMPAIGHAGQIGESGFACAPGLTKRELFAAMQRCPDDLSMSWGEAMVGPYPSYDEHSRMRYDEAGMRWWAATEARYRVMYADALLAELERTA